MQNAHTSSCSTVLVSHVSVWRDDVMTWKRFPHYWPYVKEIHQSPVDFPSQKDSNAGFDVFLDVSLNNRFNKQPRLIEDAMTVMWRHCYEFDQGVSGNDKNEDTWMWMYTKCKIHRNHHHSRNKYRIKNSCLLVKYPTGIIYVCHKILAWNIESFFSYSKTTKRIFLDMSWTSSTVPYLT